MNSFRILSAVILLFALGACSSGGDDGPSGIPKCGAGRCAPVVNPIDEPKDFFAQNAEYSAQFIQNALDEKRDFRLQEIYQDEKIAADLNRRNAKKRVNAQKLKVKQLENELAELKAKDGSKAGAVADLKLKQEANDVEIGKLNTLIANIDVDIEDVEEEKSLKQGQKFTAENNLRKKTRARNRKRQEIQGIRNTNQALRDQNTQKQAEVKKINNRIAKLQADLETAETPEAKNDIRDKIKQRKLKRRGLNKQIADNKQTIQNNRQKLPGLRNQLAALQKDVDRLETRVNNIQTQIVSLNDEIKTHERRRDSKVRERRALVQQNKNIDKQIASLGDLPLEISEKQDELVFAQNQLSDFIDQHGKAKRVYTVKAKNFSDHTASVKIKRDSLERLEKLNDKALDQLYFEL